VSAEIRVLLVDDHAMLRKGMAVLLDDEPDIEVVGEADDGEKAVEQTLSLKPDVVIMDITMPRLNGIEATRRILTECPESKIIALSIHSSKRFVDDMLNAGASGYLLKESVPEELIHGIRVVMRNEMFLSSAITGTVVGSYVEAMSDNGLETDVGIMQTKLHAPPIPPDMVSRPRLLERLDAGRERPLTLISAGPGYGKCVLASSWLQTSEWRGAWVSLDESDNDLRHFLRYFVAAVQSIFPDACEETLELINTPGLPQLPILLAKLSNELGSIDQPFVLVLDDYHQLNVESAVHELINQLLAHPPIPLHLMILTRYDPPLELVTLRARDQLTEIRAQDLAFDELETQELLEKTLAFTASSEAISNLQQEVEGWAAGLRLVSLALHEVAKPDEYLKNLHGGIAETRAFLLQEVISRHSPQMQQWLLATCVLERFCPELCDELCASYGTASGGEFTSADFIAKLLDKNLFTIPLDTQGEWFRYHKLFQDLLREQLKISKSPAEIATLHSRASQWFESQDLIDEAIHHALAMEDVERAAQLVERNARVAMNKDKWYVVVKWLNQLPAAVVEERPELLLATALMYFFHMKAVAIEPLLDRIDELMGGDPMTHDFSGEVATFRGFLAFYRDDTDRALSYLEHAMGRVSATDLQYRSVAEGHFLIAQQMAGKIEQVTRDTLGRLKNQTALSPQAQAVPLFGLVYIHYLAADLKGVARYNERQREIAEEHGLKNALAWCDYLEGLSCLQRNELDEAIRFLEVARDGRNFHVRRAAVDALGALALAYQLNREPDRAAETMKSLAGFAAHHGPRFKRLADSYAARLALMQERPEVAIRWLNANTKLPPRPEMLVTWLEASFLTKCRALIAEGSAASLQKAERRLQEYAELNEAQHNSLQLIGILALQAVACEKQGKGEEATIHLQRALTLGSPGGFIFPFVELGQPMVDMLRGLPEQGANTEHIEKILFAFENAKNKAAIAARASPSGQLLSDSLTNRELEILQLLAQRLQNKEIAARLFVSSETVKTHLKHLYQKLAVGNRREAAAKAMEILSSREQDTSQS
jgi:LuxR family maltose regulon positive regulatory protein